MKWYDGYFFIFEFIFFFEVQFFIMWGFFDLVSGLYIFEVNFGEICYILFKD